jgi:CubicO group peptidase (beta-lactamase class C family)
MLGLGMPMQAHAQGLAAAVLPSARGGVVGQPLTVFGLTINATSQSLSGCQPVIDTAFTGLPLTDLTFQTTDPTNALTGTTNTPFALAPGQSQGVVLAFTPTQTFEGREVGIRFQCSEGARSGVLAGVNTVRLTARTASRPDVLAIAATASQDGHLAIPSAGETGAFAVAILNNGTAQPLRISVDQGRYQFPVQMRFCETQSSGACLASPTDAPLVLSFAEGEVRTFSVFVDADDDLGTPFLPDIARVFVRASASSGTELAATSIAVSAPAPAFVQRPLDLEGAWQRASADGARALLIQRDGEVLFERYLGPLAGQDVPQLLNSGTKSFVCPTVAAATDRGLVGLDDFAWSRLSAWTPSSSGMPDLALKSQIRLRDLMSISHGIPSGGADGDVSDNDIYLEVQNQPSAYAPGLGALYGRMGFFGVAAMLEGAIGEDPVVFLERTVLTPIGMTVSEWGRDRNGKPNFSAEAKATARNWAKFGRLLLNDGRWEGNQILSASSVRRCAHYRWAGYEGYGLGFWLNRPVLGSLNPLLEYVPPEARANPDPMGPILPAAPRDAYVAWGANNMQMFIIPSQRLIIVKFAGEGSQNAFFEALFAD